MRVLAIVAAAVVGGFVCMVALTAVALAFGAGAGATEAASVLGAVGGAAGLGVLVARLVPARPSRLRDRGRERMGR